VERPQSTGIAGGGFMLVRLAKAREPLAFDFREMAPSKAHRDMFLDSNGQVISDASTLGAQASGVPGMVAGVLAIHEKYGRLPRAVVLQPSIDLAERGFAVYSHLAEALEESKAVLKKSPAAVGIFFEGGNPERPLRLGARLRQPQLARVLREIAAKGRDGFYKGWVAEALVAEQRRLGGMISMEDLAKYEVKVRAPVHAEYGPYRVYSMAPPSSGGVHIAQMLNIVGGYGDQVARPGRASRIYPFAPLIVHRTATVMQMAYHDRALYLGDTDFVHVPVNELTSPAYAASWRRLIRDDQALHLEASEGPRPTAAESHETTHFTLGDAEGNVVSSTQTINGWFGSGVVVPGAGFVMNNEMDDFSAKPGVPNKFGVTGGEENAIAGGKRPLSSMSPTIVLAGGEPVLALGSPSGSQIINCVLLTTLNYLTYGLPLWESVAAVRYHHQWKPDEILVEKPGFSPELAAALRDRGHNLKVGQIGCKVEAVAYEGGSLHGVADPRGEGLAASEKPLPAFPDVPGPVGGNAHD
jgi:gamma-glutamyltranspeptidase/glutathione hydrolase